MAMKLHNSLLQSVQNISDIEHTRLEDTSTIHNLFEKDKDQTYDLSELKENSETKAYLRQNIEIRSDQDRGQKDIVLKQGQTRKLKMLQKRDHKIR